MSNYDPFRIYTKRSKSTHKGQVLRKKIPNYIGYCFTDEELERAIEGLKSRGYHIYAPGVFPPQTIFYSDVYVIDSGSLNFLNAGDTISAEFSTLWNIIGNDFGRVLQVDPIKTSNVLFGIDILSINLYGTFQLPNAGPNRFDLSIYFFDPNSPVNITENANPSLSAYSDDDIYSLQSYSNNEFLGTYVLKNYTNNLRAYSGRFNKREATNSPYLYTIIRQQPAILTALKNRDYNVFNPNLFNVTFSGVAPGPLNISRSFYTVRVHLQYNV